MPLENRIKYPKEIVKRFQDFFTYIYGDEYAVDVEDFKILKPMEIKDGKVIDSGKSSTKMFGYTPSDVGREIFLEDVEDFLYDYPEVEIKILSHKTSGGTSYAMAKNKNTAFPERKSLEGIKGYKEYKNDPAKFDTLPPMEFHDALDWFKKEYGREYDDSNPEDRENILALFKEKMNELKEQGLQTEFEIIIPVGRWSEKTETRDSVNDSEDEEYYKEYGKAMRAFERVCNEAFVKNNGIDDNYVEQVKIEIEKLLKEHKDSIAWINAWEEFSDEESDPFEIFKGWNPLKPVEDSKKEKIKDSVKTKDSNDELYQMCLLLGKIHDAIMEAQEYANDLEAEDKISSNLGYALDDLEADASYLDYMGEADPVESLLENYGSDNIDFDPDEIDEEEDW